MKKTMKGIAVKTAAISLILTMARTRATERKAKQAPRRVKSADWSWNPTKGSGVPAMVAMRKITEVKHPEVKEGTIPTRAVITRPTAMRKD